MCEVMREFAEALQRQANLLFTKIMGQVCFLNEWTGTIKEASSFETIPFLMHLSVTETDI
jgi:hypothetical protein